MVGYPGTYNDGRTATRVPVTVSLDLDGLGIAGPDGQRVAHWPYRELEHLDEVFEAKQGLRLRVRPDEGARLLLPNHALLEDLVARAPQLAVRHRRWAGQLVRWAGLSVASVAVLAAVLWIALPRFAETAAQAVPISWEVSLGEIVLDQVVTLFAKLEGRDEPLYCEAAAGRRVLDEVTGRLAAAADSPYRFKVSVLDLDMANAFALPGGRIVLFRGLLDFVDSPDEVVGVLAHEMGHVVHRHSTESLIKSLGLTFFFGVMLGDVGSGLIGVAGETLVSMSFSREAEGEADSTAVTLLEQLHIGTQGLAAFFARLTEEHGDMEGAMALLSTHPSNKSRQALFDRPSEASEAALDEADWRSLREICPEAPAEDPEAIGL